MNPLPERHWTYVFIEKPYFAIVIALLTFLLGLRSLLMLQVRKFPEIEQSVLTISAVYPGASSSLMQSAVVNPIQRLVSEADGIDYIRATIQDSSAQIKLYLKTGYDSDLAFTQVLGRLQAAKRALPKDMDDPTLFKSAGNSIALMYVAYTSQGLSSSKIYEYLDRIIRPQILTIQGVSEVSILGSSRPAMRVWLDFDKMHAHQVTVEDLDIAFMQENFLLPSGNIYDASTQIPIDIKTQGTSVVDFEQLVVKKSDSFLIRLKDIAKIEQGSASYDPSVVFNDQSGVFISINTLPTANALTVISHVRESLKSFEKTLPPQLNQKVVYDASIFIQESIDEVVKTIIEATVIVTLIIYLFLRDVRAMLIPVVAIPLSIVGVGICLHIMGYSINLLTLLAMILAIGLVVDDAIVVVENADRHLEQGDSPLEAIKKSTSEIANPVISMTLIVAIAYLPMALLQGLTGSLFREFAYTLSCSVLISGMIALILSPVMCLYLLKPNQGDKNNLWLTRITDGYAAKLEGFFEYKKSILIFVCLNISLVGGLFYLLAQELAPKEDQGFALVTFQAPESANANYAKQQAEYVKSVLKSFKEGKDYFLMIATGNAQSGFGGFIAKPWKERTRSVDALEGEFRSKLSQIPGVEAYSFTPNSLPGVDGLPFQMIIYGSQSLSVLNQEAQAIVKRCSESGYFPFIRTDLKINQPRWKFELDREKALLAGIPTSQTANSLFKSLAQGASSKFSFNNSQFDVILQSSNRDLLHLLHKLPLRSKDDQLIRLNDVGVVKLEIEPNSLYQFNQLNAVGVSGMIFPLFTISEVLTYLKPVINELNEKEIFVDFVGQTRTYLQESGQLIKTFFFALVVVYLVLVAQFQSFREPLIILMAVPLALSGALVMMHISSLIAFSPDLKQYNVTMNIYTQLALLTLTGLIAKHGILIVEVANQLRKEGFNAEESAKKAAILRFRPILMTSVSTIVGVMPLLFAQGPGAVSRFHLGFVIASGFSLGTLFTVFIVPVLYSFMEGNDVFDESLLSKSSHE